MIARLLLPLLLLLGLGGCALKPERPRTLQSVDLFLDQAPPPLAQAALDRHYTDLLAHRYEPWRLDDLNATPAQAAWPVAYYAGKAIYGENLRPIPKRRFDAWVRNARYDALDTLRRRAITVRPTSLRLFPTHRPIFYDPEKPGEGYPFDYNQNSAVKAMVPLYVSHLSMDGGWAFVRTPFALGWVPIRDIAYLDDENRRRLTAMPLLVLLKDRAPLYDGDQAFVFYAQSATLLPGLGRKGDLYETLLPDGGAFASAWLPASWGASMPLPMTRDNIACVAATLLGTPYTWGGLLQDRDCSATVRDFFMPFGIWLPRNSAAQAKVGRVIDLQGLAPKAKERRIIAEGVPFRTLLHMPGHILLYVGHRDGHAYALQNLWGIRTRSGGRILIGETVVTDLWLGADLPDADPESLPIRRIDSMNIVTER